MTVKDEETEVIEVEAEAVEEEKEKGRRRKKEEETAAVEEERTPHTINILLWVGFLILFK